MESLRDCDDVSEEHCDKFDEPCKFIGKDFEIVNDQFIKNRLSHSTGFLVVGVIGKQSVGKSFVLNLLANNWDSESFVRPFNLSGIGELIANTQKTVGVDIHVTADRIILLDCQPILSLSQLSLSMEKEKKIKVFSNDDPENEGKVKMTYSSDIISVQLISFFLSVCHVLLIVDDRIINYRLLRLIDLAHRLKSWIPSNPTHLPLQEPKHFLSNFNTDNEFHDYVSHMFFVENMCPKIDVSREQINDCLRTINHVLISYHSRIDEQNMLNSWLKEMKDKERVKYNNLQRKRRLQLQKDKLANDSNVLQLDAADETDNESENEPGVTPDEERDIKETFTLISEQVQQDGELAEKQLHKSIQRPIRLIRLPVFDSQDSNYAEKIILFQKTVFGCPRKHFCVTQNERFTELCWLEYAIEIWQSIRESQLIPDFFYSYSNSLINDI